MFKYLDFTEVSHLIIKSKNTDNSSLGYLKKSVLDFIRQSRIEPCFYYKGYLRAIIKGNFSSTIDEARFLFEGYIRPPTGTVRKVFAEYNDYRECPWNRLLGSIDEDTDSVYIQKVHIVEVVDLQEQHDEYYLNRKRSPFDLDKSNELYIEPQTYSYEEMYFSSIDVSNIFNSKHRTNYEGLAQKLTEAEKRILELENKLEQAKAELADKPTDSTIHSNTDIQNIKKAAIRQFNRSLAVALIDLDYQSNLRKGDIVNFIIPHMKELAYVLADEQTDKAKVLTVKYKTIYDTHLQGLEFKQGTQTTKERERVNIDLLFKKQLPVTE